MVSIDFIKAVLVFKMPYGSRHTWKYNCSYAHKKSMAVFVPTFTQLTNAQ